MPKFMRNVNWLGSFATGTFHMNKSDLLCALLNVNQILIPKQLIKDYTLACTKSEANSGAIKIMLAKLAMFSVLTFSTTISPTI